MQEADKHRNDHILIASERILARLLEQIWTALLVVITLAGAASVLRAYATGWQPIYSLHIALIIFFSGSYLLRKRLSFDVRIGIVMVVFYVAGISALFSFGMVGAGTWWLLLCALIAKVFYPVKVGIAHAIACLLLVAAAAYGYITGLLTLPFEIGDYLRSPATWASLITGCVLLSCCIFAAVAAYQRAMLGLLREAAEGQRQLELNLKDLLQREADRALSPCLCPDCGRQLPGDAMDRARLPGDSAPQD